MARRQKRLPAKVRVNFDMDRKEYTEFKKLCEAADTDASKAMRQLVRGFIKRRAKESFAKAVVRESGMEKLSDPDMPETQDEKIENVA